MDFIYPLTGQTYIFNQ